MFSFARKALLWLTAAAVRLKMNSLRSALTAASPAINHLISGQRKTHMTY